MLAVLLLAVLPLLAADWPQFRGQGASGISESTRLPSEIGPNQNVVWKTPLPAGHSSPIVTGNIIFLTAGEGGQRKDAGRDKVVDDGGRLFTFALDRATGRILWRREAPRPRIERYQPTNSPASPTPLTDGRNVYVFFGDFGMVAYDLDGGERWRVPLGPFNNVNGHGSSPVLAGENVVLLCDPDTGSFLIAVNKKTGKVAWKVNRPEFTRSYTTPTYFTPAKGPAELLVSGSYQLTSYHAETGEKLWWVRGLSWQPKSAPIVLGDMIFAHWWEGGGEAETPTETPTFEEVLAKYDKNADRLLTAEELAPLMPNRGAVTNSDLNSDTFLDEHEWNNYRARRASRNRLIAVRHGGRGDLTNSNVVWSMQKFLPNCPTPVIYQGVLYLVKDGGIFTAVNPKTGEILKQGRLTGAIDTYYASPVAAAGRIYLLSQKGKGVVIKAGADWEVVHVTDFEEEIYATPAIVDNRLFLRTRSGLFCFAEKNP
ncbi:MAG: PQQ-binding-like beta-propeller repeat protein [Bryobacteraceae bacterium]